LHVGHQVAMGQHRSLGHTGGAAGVLQERDVARLDVQPGQRLALAQGEGVAKSHRALDFIVRHHFLDVLQDEVHHRPLGETEHVAQPRGQDVLDLGAGQRLGRGVAEVVDHDQRLGAGILQLVVQFARGVERVDIHHGQTGAQDAEDRDRELQAVGHHHRHARPALELELVQQIAGHLPAQTVHVRVGQDLAEVEVGRPIPIPVDGPFKGRDDRRKFVDVDFVRHARWIAGKPMAGPASSCMPLPGGRSRSIRLP